MRKYRTQFESGLTTMIPAHHESELRERAQAFYPHDRLTEYVEIFPPVFRKPSEEMPPLGVQVWVQYDNGHEGVNWTEDLIGGEAFREDEGKVVGWMHLSEAGTHSAFQ